MLPKGVKDLAEISDLDRPEDRARELGGLLEHLLKTVTPNGRRLKFVELLKINQAQFPNFAKLQYAREARNSIVHGDRVSERAILQAEGEFQIALAHFLPVCPKILQDDARGSLRPPPFRPPAPETPDPVAQNPTAPRGEPAPKLPTSPLPPSPPLDPDHRFRPGVIWYTLAAGFLLVAVFAYIVGPHHDKRQPAVTAAQVAPALPQTLPLPSEPQTVPPQRRTEPAQPRRREDEFRKLINTNLSLSSTQPNVALLIESTGPGITGSVANALQGFLADTRVHLIGNLANIEDLKGGGFFEDLYGGNGQFLIEAARLSRVDYILLGKAAYSFRRQVNLDPDLLTCDLTLVSRLVDRTGTVVRSGSFTAAGPGFTQEKALESATENVARQLKERILDPIR